MTMSDIPIIVGHQDTLLNLYLPERGHGRDFFERSEIGHIDLPRAQAGGIGGGFFAIFIPPPASVPVLPTGGLTLTAHGYTIPLPDPLEPEYALHTTLAMVALLFRLEARSQGQLKVVQTVAELENCLQTGVHAALLHFEGAEAIDPDLDALEVFYRAGLRSLGPVWSRPNRFGHGVPFQFPYSPDTGPGLTEAGKRLALACNRLGIMLDLSHLNEQGFWDIAALSDAPLVATHSNAHALCASSRNLTDKQLAAIKESQGLVGLNFSVPDVRLDARRDPDVSLDLLVKHMDYLVEHLGIEGVALGLDLDGAMIPSVIGDAAGLPKLLFALREHGYDDESMRLLAYKNWLRVLARTWK
jgi:membrane dipeptidase